MDRESIMKMEPGIEMNTMIGEMLGIEPISKWWAMNREETGIFIEFGWEPDATKWMLEQNERFPEWVLREGCHIVKKGIYKNYSESIAAAWEVFQHMKGQLFSKRRYFMDRLSWVVIGDVKQPVTWPDLMWFIEPIHTCKAALLTVLEDKSHD